jgi:hypothetical protein
MNVEAAASHIFLTQYALGCKKPVKVVECENYRAIDA